MMNAYGLRRYLTAATLVRGADGAAAVGLVLLAVNPSTGLRHGAQVGGVLSAALTAPHLLGPWVARRLDRARDGRTVLAAAFAAYGVALAAAALLLGRAPLALVGIAVVAASACGPLLTGGLSSRLAGIVAGDDRSLRRAQGWDAVTYGLAGSAGPALVAVVATAATPLTAVLTLAGAALVAAPLTLTLPRTEPAVTRERDALTVRAALALIVGRGPLRRVTIATMLPAVSGGALAVVAVMFGSALSARPGAGAVLIAAFGVGNLAGSLLVTAFPMRGEPETLTTRHVALLGAAFGLCALAPSYPLALGAFALAGASNAPYFTATLAARSRNAPARARAQVFVSLAGVKTAMGSLGTALAGAAVGFGPRALLVACAALTLVAAAATVLDRSLAGTRASARPADAPSAR